ncbi:hypothetical protein pb186bvf_013331 [Paramecium bursaria]
MKILKLRYKDQLQKQVKVQLTQHGLYYITLSSDAGILEFNGKNQVLVDFYNRIKYLGIQTNFFEMYKLEGQYGQSVIDSQYYRTLTLIKNQENLKRIKMMRQLPIMFLQVVFVFEELEHYYIVFEKLPQIKQLSHAIYYQILHAMWFLEENGYCILITDIYQDNYLKVLPEQIVDQNMELECIRKVTEQMLFTDEEFYHQLYKNPQKLNHLIYDYWFIQKLSEEYILLILSLSVKPPEDIQEYLENNVVQIQSFKSIYEDLKQDDDQLNSSIDAYQTLIQHQHNKSSKQFALDSLFSENILKAQQYEYLQEIDQSLTDLGLYLQKEIQQSPEQGSTCPSTMKIISKEIRLEKLYDIIQAAKEIEQQEQINKKRITILQNRQLVILKRENNRDLQRNRLLGHKSRNKIEQLISKNNDSQAYISNDPQIDKIDPKSQSTFFKLMLKDIVKIEKKNQRFDTSKDRIIYNIHIKLIGQDFGKSLDNHYLLLDWPNRRFILD